MQSVVGDVRRRRAGVHDDQAPERKEKQQRGTGRRAAPTHVRARFGIDVALHKQAADEQACTEAEADDEQDEQQREHRQLREISVTAGPWVI